MTKKTKKVISNVAFYTALALIYLIAFFAILTKFNGGSVYLGNLRADVVLSESMSVRNKNHEAFLEGTTQIQKMDMVVSEKINDNTELKVKDCVLFNNPNFHNELVVHRIVDITAEGVALNVNSGEKKQFNNEDVLYLNPQNGEVIIQAIDYTKIQLVCYSKEELASYYVLLLGKNVEQTTCEDTQIAEGVYKHVITFQRTSSAPIKATFVPGTYSDVYISNITYTTVSKGDLVFYGSEFVPDESNNYKKLFDPHYLYEIRGDKSNSSDGIFERDILQAKVVGILPGLGHVVHFLQSIPGLITIIGLGIIITLASYFWTANEKKKVKLVEGDIVENNVESIEGEEEKEVTDVEVKETDEAPPEIDDKKNDEDV